MVLVESILQSETIPNGIGTWSSGHVVTIWPLTPNARGPGPGTSGNSSPAMKTRRLFGTWPWKSCGTKNRIGAGIFSAFRSCWPGSPRTEIQRRSEFFGKSTHDTRGRSICVEKTRERRTTEPSPCVVSFRCEESGNLKNL